VTLRSVNQISAFWAIHNTSEDRIRSRLLLIQNLWIGNTSDSGGNLTDGHIFWPLPIITRILWSCTRLRSLYLINIDQNDWIRLEKAIPASMESMAMGPVHGPLHIKDLTREPRIRKFTSAQSFMRDDEVRDVILSPHMQKFRVLFSAQRASQIQTLEQVGCISETETIEEIEFLILGPTPSPSLLQELKEKLRNITTDRRVKIRTSPIASWIEFLYSEFLAEADTNRGEQSRMLLHFLTDQ